MASGADSLFEVGGRSLFDESDTTAPAPAPRLGWAFFKGTSGLPKDPVRARYWLKKVVDRECELRAQEGYEDRADAARWLHELDGGDDALYARLQRQHEEHQRRQREATALRE